jgi:hypothetical protein
MNVLQRRRPYFLSMNASLQPLLDTLSTLDFEEFGRLALIAVTWAANDVTLHLVVHQQDHADEPWRLHCAGVRGSQILNDQGINSLRIETEHPVLLPHTEPIAELYFSERPSNPDAVVGQLIEAHRGVVGAWFDCLHFFNLGRDRSLRGMLDGGHGKLAAGPQSVIERYAEVLRGAGIAVSSPPSRPPVWWDGTRWVEEVKLLFALILGESYVVSSAVTAERG